MGGLISFQAIGEVVGLADMIERCCQLLDEMDLKISNSLPS